MSEVAKMVGDRIRILRNEQGLSQEELAHKADVHPSYMGTIERGEKSPTVDSLSKIINALGVTFEEFFRFTSFSAEDEQMTVLFEIVNRLNKRNVKDLKTVVKLIDVLLPWKDDNTK